MTLIKPGDDGGTVAAELTGSPAPTAGRPKSLHDVLGNLCKDEVGDSDASCETFSSPGRAGGADVGFLPREDARGWGRLRERDGLASAIRQAMPLRLKAKSHASLAEEELEGRSREKCSAELGSRGVSNEDRWVLGS